MASSFPDLRTLGSPTANCHIVTKLVMIVFCQINGFSNGFTPQCKIKGEIKVRPRQSTARTSCCLRQRPRYCCDFAESAARLGDDLRRRRRRHEPGSAEGTGQRQGRAALSGKTQSEDRIAVPVISYACVTVGEAYWRVLKSQRVPIIHSNTCQYVSSDFLLGRSLPAGTAGTSQR